MSTDTLDAVIAPSPSPAPSAAQGNGMEPAHSAETQDPANGSPLRVLLIAENASFRFGGEAVLPMHYFRFLRARGVPVWMITNQRNAAELSHALSPDDFARLHFIPDGKLYDWLNRIAAYLPQTLASFTIGQWIEVRDQFRARKLGRALIARHGINVVHQPTPVSPKHVSAIDGMGVPVVMGPLNGGITYPPGFKKREQWFDRLFVPVGRTMAGIVNRLLPGKLNAAAVLVANVRTARAIPNVRGRVETVVENGVDLAIYRERAAETSHAATPAVAGDGSANTPAVRFAFAGRLVHWKGVDLLLEAVKKARGAVHLHLDIMGDGPWRQRLIEQARALGVDDVVTFHGWMSHQNCAAILQKADVFVLPSLRECGGAAVLEAMAMRLPVIATRWGGPVDYLETVSPGAPACGMLVDPAGPEAFTSGLAEAMTVLARNPQQRRAMGDAGYARVVREYDWERKVDRVIAIYKDAVARHVRAK